MKLLLDECLDQHVRRHIPGHDIFTVGYMGWTSKRNGQLLRLAADNGFDAVLTTDRGIRHQHDPSTLPVAVICIHARSNGAADILPLVPKLLEVLRTLTPRTFADVT